MNMEMQLKLCLMVISLKPEGEVALFTLFGEP